MPQLSLYIDDKTFKKIERSAYAEKQSLSSWVRIRLDTSLASSWPAGYFELFGSLKEMNVARPKNIPFSKDVKRESL